MKKQSPFQQPSNSGGREAAINLIKERIRSLYGNEKEISPRPQSELVDRFWEQHKDDPNPQAAWQRFYAGLSDDDKHMLWNEYHSASMPKEKTRELKRKEKPQPKTPSPSVVITNDDSHSHSFEEPKTKKIDKIKKVSKAADKEKIKESKEKLISSIKSAPKSKSLEINKKKSRAHWRPLIISLSVMAFWLLAQYNPLLIAMAKQYVSPGDTLRSPVIVDPSASIEISDDPRIIIPKINVDVPVVYDVRTREESAIQDALERGVVHYAGTSVPGQAGNNVIVGHSSNNFLNSGKFKFAFVLLDRLELNDTFILHYEGVRFVYKVTNKQVVEPTDFSLTLPTATPTTTLITCTPPGTSWKRLIIQAEQISPTVSAEQLDSSNIPSETVETPEEIVPGNAPSLWQRFTDWLF
jgi:LPXTG-site transpeptidase (sortase) family protein